ncbi:MAG: hypothetical protein AB7J35_02320 [Dehalococcoidia bacterium]
MPTQSESAERALDVCLDCLLAGKDWNENLPGGAAERAVVASLMEVAVEVLRIAQLSTRTESARRRRIWQRVASQTTQKQSRLRSIAFYRLPYLPPLWIRPEAC